MEDKSFTDVINETVDKAAEKAKPYVDKAAEKAKPVVEKAKSKAKSAKEQAKPVVEKAKKQVKPVVKAAKDKAKEVKKAVDSRIYEHEVIVQYEGNSYYAKDMNERAIEDFVSKGGKKDQIKQVQLYVKPEEKACYYVINNKETGRVDI
ncbi:MAG: hypothetical protein J5829_08695 [Lachnospiraceae bacterium]|nr:hypothetical protein [Lachnospiraceae bacterium]